MHCDVKPENVSLCREGDLAGRPRQAKLIDFGLSRPRAQDARLDPSEVAGTPAHAASEPISGRTQPIEKVAISGSLTTITTRFLGRNGVTSRI